MLPLSPTTRRVLALAAAALVLVVLAARHVAGAGTATAVEPTARLEPVAPATRPRVVVHVVGAVRRPGLYRLAGGSRIADAVERAGGATPHADLELVNLAAPVADGAQVVVPRSGPRSPSAGAAPPGAGPPPGKLSLNRATAEELDTLPGVGPATAARILAYRQEHGAIGSVDELDAVPGIGPARLEQLRELVTP